MAGFREGDGRSHRCLPAVLPRSCLTEKLSYREDVLPRRCFAEKVWVLLCDLMGTAPTLDPLSLNF